MNLDEAMENQKISFVIPCYNTTYAIRSVLEEIAVSMEKLKKKGYSYEVILVNDSSPNPGTLSLLKEVVDKSSADITLVNLAMNVGQPNAILAGCRVATGDYIMTSDDDGQTPMDQVEQFVAAMEKGYDVVCAKYTKRTQKSVVRKLGSKLNNMMSSMLIRRPEGVEMTTIFLAKRFVVDEITKYDQPYAYLSGLILRTTQNIANVEIEQRKRIEGTSGYSFKKLLRLWLNGATAFSIVPLRIADGIGVGVALAGFVMAVVTVIRKILFVDYQPGWSSIISVLLILFGINLLVLGMIGDFIGRIYLSINKTPQSVVREIYKNKGK